MLMLIIKQRRAILLSFVFVLILGIFSLNDLGTAELPEPPGSGIEVSAILPGASPEEMDKKVARLLHEAIKDISGVKEVTSSAKESFVSLSVKFASGNGDYDAMQREVTQVISQVSDLPVKLEGPFVSRQVNRLFPVMTLLFEGGSHLQRHQAWFEIKQAIKGISAVDLVDTLGDREQRIEIQLKPLKLQQLGLRIDQASKIVQRAITDRSAGRIESFMSLQRIRVKAHPNTLEELEAIPINIKGNLFRLEQLANVEEVLSPEKITINHQGNNAWYINVYRRKGSKVSEISQSLNAVIDSFNHKFSQQQVDLKLSVVQDRNVVVTQTLNDLRNSIIAGMSLVLIVLCLFFGFRYAIYAAIGIPFSFFATFIAMDILGLSLNTLTLFGLVLVCGMVVDDAIVVLESVFKKIEQGEHIELALSNGVKDVFPAVVCSTVTTIVAFFPLLFMSGEMGSFVSQIPKVAILALIASLVECFVILPIHIYRKQKTTTSLIQSHLSSHGGNRLMNRKMTVLAHNFSKLTAKFIKHPGKSMLAFLLLFVLSGIVSYLNMDFKMFNASEVRSLKFYLTLQKNTDLETTSRLVSAQARKLQRLKHVKDVVILNGYSDYNYARSVRSNIATVELLLMPEGQQPHQAAKLAEQTKELLKQVQGIKKLRVVMAENKPPEQAPVKIYLYGNNTEKLKVAVNNVRSALATINSIENISNPMEDGIIEKVFNINSDMVSHYGLQAQEIANLLHIAVTGEKVAKMDRGNEVVDVYVTSEKPSTFMTNVLNQVTLADGRVIATDNLGHFTKQLSPETIRRYQGQRYIRITADINQSVLSTFKTHRKIEQVITQNLLPSDVSFEQLGEFSNTQESLHSMLKSSGVALGLTYFILVLLFRSYLQPLIVMLTIPLAYVGVVWGFTLTGKPLSLMGLIGIIGLIGIVVNDSLVWIDCYNKQRAKGVSCEHAAEIAVKLRFRPIMLTTITSILGLLPISLANSAGIAGAMADTIVSGLLVASVLLMFFLPVSVVMIERITATYNALIMLKFSKTKTHKNIEQLS